MPGLVHILCAITSLLSGCLLLRGGMKRGGGLLLWSALCFLVLAANNALLYVNYVILPDVDLLLACRILTAIGILLLNIGMIWHAT